MDDKRKKELITEYKNRRPDMGVISIKCKETGESFLGASSDTKADINSNRAKLSMGGHPNKRLAELWNQYGESGFEFSVIETLKCESPTDDYKKKLEELRQNCLDQDDKASKIWKV